MVIGLVGPTSTQPCPALPCAGLSPRPRPARHPPSVSCARRVIRAPLQCPSAVRTSAPPVPPIDPPSRDHTLPPTPPALRKGGSSARPLASPSLPAIHAAPHPQPKLSPPEPRPAPAAPGQAHEAQSPQATAAWPSSPRPAPGGPGGPLAELQEGAGGGASPALITPNPDLRTRELAREARPGNSCGSRWGARVATGDLRVRRTGQSDAASRAGRASRRCRLAARAGQWRLARAGWHASRQVRLARRERGGGAFSWVVQTQCDGRLRPRLTQQEHARTLAAAAPAAPSLTGPSKLATTPPVHQPPFTLPRTHISRTVALRPRPSETSHERERESAVRHGQPTTAARK